MIEFREQCTGNWLPATDHNDRRIHDTDDAIAYAQESANGTVDAVRVSGLLVWSAR